MRMVFRNCRCETPVYIIRMECSEIVGVELQFTLFEWSVQKYGVFRNCGCETPVHTIPMEWLQIVGVKLQFIDFFSKTTCTPFNSF